MASLERNPCGLSTRATLPLLGHSGAKVADAKRPAGQMGHLEKGCLMNSRSVGSRSQNQSPGATDHRLEETAWFMCNKTKRSPGKDKRSRASREEWAWAANLPTSFRETGDLHPEHGTTRTRNRRAILGTRKVLLASRTTSKLHRQSLSFEVTAIYRQLVSKSRS